MAAYQAIPYAERTLMAGFTTVRDLGREAFMDVALRDAIAKGIVRGPHILAATKGIGATGGHFDDSNGFRDELLFSPPPKWITPTESPMDPRPFAKAVRFEIKNGADVIEARSFGWRAFDER